MNIAGHITLLVHPGMVKVLASLIQMLADGLREISIETDIVHELPQGFNGQAIVLGANLYGEVGLAHLPANSVIFNVENHTSDWMSSEYTNTLRRFSVWDFNESNSLFLSERISRPVHYFKMFYVGGLLRILDTNDDIDVLFYGSFNDRRSKILDEMRARGLRVEAVYNVFGDQLDRLIARSKVVLNLHFYDSGQLEIIRVFDLLANKRAVVSEVNSGELVDADLASAFVAATYENLVDVTEALVNDPDRRHKVAAAGFEAFSQRRAKEILPEALAWSDLPRLPGDMVIGSGKMYDPHLLNIDISSQWNPDIVADISDPELLTREFISRRFGAVRLRPELVVSITAQNVLEKIQNLVVAMKNCLELLTYGGELKVYVPYDLSYGAWQDPTNVHAFNERSWYYYCEWHWYLGWTEARFDLIEQTFHYSSLGRELAARGVSHDEILRSPRAVDEIHVVLRKRQLTGAERAHGRQMWGDIRA
ncbi:glycosyltransferase [Mesorhizobium sp. AR07]|uniref:glycosyltransferase family protein n=1 Tax=Mesorhizobium sp. AR07 TaxID=2865838 RepID=UPI00215E1863|nr:glycosyltransferase [Mesorhizobium sp. AR07]UVK46589.1 glycosyltransferase [Mesorhizobium sp. AR07]